MPNNEQVYIRPRRGTKTTMTDTEKSALVLKEGEIFFEFPDEGIGKGPAKVKIGDGVSAYVDLPYVLGNETEYTYVDFIEERDDNPQLLINQIISGISISKFVANAKRIMQLLLNKFTEYLPISGGTIEGDLIVEGNVTAESQTIKSEATGSTTFVISNEQNDNVEVIVPDHSGTLALVSDFPISDDYDATSGSAMSGIAVNKALQTLDVTGDSNIAAGKTIKSWTEEDGKVNITTQNISITKSQVSDFPTIGNGTLTLTKGSQTTTFTANQTGNASMVIPSALGDLTQNASYRTVSDTEKTTWNNKASTAVATQSANGLMSSGDKSKLDGIATGAEVNQKAFSSVKIDGTLPWYHADSKTASLQFFQGLNASFSYSVHSEYGDGISISAKDEKVKQTPITSSTNNPYRVLLSGSDDDIERTEGVKKGGLYWSWASKALFLGDLTSDYGFLHLAGTQALHIGASGEEEYRVFLGVRDQMWSLAPVYHNRIKLGSPSFRWNQLYVVNANIDSSDRNLKKDIKDLDNKLTKDFIMDLKPVSYKFKDGESGRSHYGLIAQDVEDTMNKLGMSSLDFAGFCKDQKYETYKEEVTESDGSVREVDKQREIKGEYTYGLRYEEFIAPLIQMVQHQQKEIDELKTMVKKLSK